MSDNLLSNILEQIDILITDAFGPDFDDDLYSMLFEEAGNPSEIFSSIPRSIQRIRSTYLPADVFSSNVAALAVRTYREISSHARSGSAAMVDVLIA